MIVLYILNWKRGEQTGPVLTYQRGEGAFDKSVPYIIKSNSLILFLLNKILDKTNKFMNTKQQHLKDFLQSYYPLLKRKTKSSSRIILDFKQVYEEYRKFSDIPQELSIAFKFGRNVLTKKLIIQFNELYPSATMNAFLGQNNTRQYLFTDTESSEIVSESLCKQNDSVSLLEEKGG